MTMRMRIEALVSGESGFGLAETLIALTILVIGLVAVSGLSLASADQARIANWRGQQAAAAQMILEEVQREGFGSVASGVDTAVVGGHAFPAKIDVSDISSRVKQVTIIVSGVGTLDTAAYRTRLYQPRPLPDPVPSP